MGEHDGGVSSHDALEKLGVKVQEVEAVA